jgi:hypothetical protein
LGRAAVAHEVSVVADCLFKRSDRWSPMIAMHVLRSSEIVDVFNYAMAEWGYKGVPSTDLMSRVLELSSLSDYRSLNRHRCFAIAHFVVGDVISANEVIQLASSANKDARGQNSVAGDIWTFLGTRRVRTSRL